MIQALLEALVEVVMTIHKIGPFQGCQQIPLTNKGGDGGPEVQGQRQRAPMINFHKTIKTLPCQPFLKNRADCLPLQRALQKPLSLRGMPKGRVDDTDSLKMQLTHDRIQE